MAKAAERAYLTIRQAILTGEHQQGSRLTETELAGAIGVSRTPVREALRRLDAEGLVAFTPNRGAQVVTYTREDLQEIFRLRAMLEAHAAERAATRISPAAIAHLEDLADAMEAAGTDAEGPVHPLDRVADLNREFHATLLAAADSPRLEQMLAAVILVPVMVRTFHRYSTTDLARSFDHHRELIAACRAADGGWAASVMRSHVHAARAVLLGEPAPEEADG